MALDPLPPLTLPLSSDKIFITRHVQTILGKINVTKLFLEKLMSLKDINFSKNSLDMPSDENLVNDINFSKNSLDMPSDENLERLSE
jgi:hypothetical protein